MTWVNPRGAFGSRSGVMTTGLGLTRVVGLTNYECPRSPRPAAVYPTVV